MYFSDTCDVQASKQCNIVSYSNALALVMYNFETPKSFWKALLYPSVPDGSHGSLNQYGFSHSSAEELLEIAMCSNTDMFLHSLVYRTKDRFSFRLREPEQDKPLQEGAPVLWQNFLHPKAIQNPNSHCKHHYGRKDCIDSIMLLTSSTDARNYSCISHIIYVCIKHRGWGKCLLHSPFNLQRKVLQIKSWGFCFHFY